MTAADVYRDLVLARQRQETELGTPLNEARWARHAPGYRFDPHREPEPLLAAALDHVRPDDELIEIGGGAGRMGLPLVLRARALVNVEPSAAMRRQFQICVEEHGIEHARSLASPWPTAEQLHADVALTVDVTYFISEIEPFVRAMHEAARRRVMIMTWTVPPPNINSALFRVVFGVAEAPSPGFRELLPVIWELGITPDVQVFDEWFRWPEQLPGDEESAIRFALEELEPHDVESARERVAAGLEQLYRRSGEVWQPTWRAPAQAMLITWRK